jgi:hypothetical protein
MYWQSGTLPKGGGGIGNQTDIQLDGELKVRT